MGYHAESGFQGFISSLLPGDASQHQLVGLPITKAMCKPSPKMKKLVQRRSRIKTFVKIVNYTHVMPTRYSVENQMVKTLKGNLTADTFTDQTAKKKFLKATRTVFEDKYKERDGQRWLFEKLRF